MPQTRVYHYVNPANGDHITSLLPPDHPEMVCLQQGSHVEETKFGFLGEFLFVLLFLALATILFLSSLLLGKLRAHAGLLDRYSRGHRLVPVGSWVVSPG